jgi:hypothetical protein
MQQLPLLDCFPNFVHHSDQKLCRIQSKKIIHQLGYLELCVMRTVFKLTFMTFQNWTHMGSNTAIYRNRHNPLRDYSFKIMYKRVWCNPPKKIAS